MWLYNNIVISEFFIVPLNDGKISLFSNCCGILINVYWIILKYFITPTLTVWHIRRIVNERVKRWLHQWRPCPTRMIHFEIKRKMWPYDVNRNSLSYRGKISLFSNYCGILGNSLSLKYIKFDYTNTNGVYDTFGVLWMREWNVNTNSARPRYDIFRVLLIIKTMITP